MRDALKSNTDLRVAANARSRAALEVASQQGGFSGGAEAAVQRAQESAEQYLLENKLPVVNEGTVGINVSYEIDLFGKLRRGVEAARAERSRQGRRRLARITVVADVVRAYVESCSAGDELAVAKQSLALQKQRVALSQRLRDAGRGNQTDVTRGVTQVRTLAADIPRFEGRRKVAQYQLAALLARSPADLPKAVAECERLPSCASRFRSATAPRCCAAAPTCAQPSGNSRPRPRGSVWRLPRCTRRSASVRRPARSVSPPTCSRPRRIAGRSAR